MMQKLRYRASSVLVDANVSQTEDQLNLGFPLQSRTLARFVLYLLVSPVESASHGLLKEHLATTTNFALARNLGGQIVRIGWEEIQVLRRRVATFRLL